MNILIISNLYPPYVLGGYEILCGQVVSYLQKRGHTVYVLTSDHKGASSSEGIFRTLSLYQPFEEKASFMRKARFQCARKNYVETKRIIQQLPIDVIFIWSLLRLTPASAHAAQESKIPVVYTFNDENITSFLAHPFSLHPKGVVHWFLDRFIMPLITLRSIDFTYSTCISNIVKRNLLNKGLPIQVARTIYQGIPVEDFPMKEQAGTLHDPIRVLYAGQLHSYKGVHTLIEAVGLCVQKQQSPPIVVTIAGKGGKEYTEKLQKRAKELHVETQCIGLIPHERMGNLYRDHDIFVFPSIWEEPFGLTHLEAMASGLPVISTANGGQGEFLEDRKNALVFTPEDEKGLSEKLLQLIEDDQLRSSLITEGRAIAQSTFAFTRYVDDLEKLLADAIQKR